jgi:Tol biopolymer transport system component
MEHKRNLKLAVVKGVIGLALGTILLATQSLASPLQEQSDRVIVALDPMAPLANRSGHAAAISPDGSSVVYVGEREGEQYLYLYSLEDQSTRVIAGSERVRRGPIFSPDGKSLVFSAGGKLRKVSLAGGEPEILCATPSFWASLTYFSQRDSWAETSAGHRPRPKFPIHSQKVLRLIVSIFS